MGSHTIGQDGNDENDECVCYRGVVDGYPHAIFTGQYFDRYVLGLVAAVSRSIVAAVVGQPAAHGARPPQTGPTAVGQRSYDQVDQYDQDDGRPNYLENH